MKNPTNRIKEKEQFKSIAKDNSGKFAKTESLALSCRFCGSSNVVKFGYNVTKEGKKARYKCKDCNAKFTPTTKLIKQIKFQSNHKDIENVKQDFKARTTSKRYVVRLFYFMFSACLYNLWILANIMVGLAILKFIPKEPFITAKMFGVMLYTLCSYLDPGG